MKTLFTNARLLDPASNLDKKGSVLVDQGKIVEIGANIAKPQNAQTVDCQGQCLAPGLIDMRADLGEPGSEHRENMLSASQAAAAGGVTTMIALPNTKPVIDDVALLQFVERRGQEVGLVKVLSQASLTKNMDGQALVEIGLLQEAGAVAFTDLPKSVASAQLMRRALSYAKNFNVLIVVHPEEPTLTSNGQMNAGELSTRLGLTGISTVAELIMIERDLRLAADTGGKLHIAHVSTAAGIDAIRKAKKDGVRVTCDTAPPYFALNENEVGAYRTFAKLSPPLRGEDDRKAVVAGLKDHTIDAIASDHSPQDVDSKRLPFAQAAVGGLGLETMLSVSLELYHNGALTLLEVLQKLTAQPAQILGLPQGQLAKGAPADFVVFDPNYAWKIELDNLRSKSKNSPFDGRPVMGKTLLTVVDGKVVFNGFPNKAMVA
jgi:dihydroorotase